MHHVLKASDVRLVPAYPGHATGYTRCAMVDNSVGSVHTGFGLCEIAPYNSNGGGAQDLHVHSYEESFYVTEGEPILVMDDRGYPMMPGACGVVPVGVPHAWVGPENGVGRWLEMQAPQPRDDGDDHTFFLGPVGAFKKGSLDIRDPRSRHFFRMANDDIQVDKLKIGSRVNSPTVSASMATALLAYSGIAVKMLVDQRLDAALANMFMVEYQPGGVAHPHDHPFEETYYFLEGEVEAVGDGKRYTLRPGDLFWTGVGSSHAFYNKTDSTVRWLETQSPQPPARHSYRFSRDWDYLKKKLQEPAEIKAAQ
jgi:mannose-6-phosphate isomerase-like protein (cupin superfamily)